MIVSAAASHFGDTLPLDLSKEFCCFNPTKYVVDILTHFSCVLPPALFG